MVRHLDLLKYDAEEEPSELERAASILATALNGADKEGHA
jgi:hypothetical protein